MSYFEIFKFKDNLYQIKDKLGVLSTLVIGDEKALLLDTCYGIASLKEEVRKITNKPLIVVNSHGHMDHACGNYEFDEVYLHENDFNLVKTHTSKKWRENNILSAKSLNALPTNFDEENYLKQTEGKIIKLNIGQIFDLGGLHLEVVKLFGHTKGQIALYIKEMKIMLTSDGACPFIWMFLEESDTVTNYIENLKHVLNYDFDYFLVGHGAKMLEKERMYSFLKVALEIDLSKSVKVTFKNFENLNSYCYTKDKMYDQNGAGIVFDPNKL